MVYKSNN